MKSFSLLLLAGAAVTATAPAAPGTLSLLNTLTLKPGANLNFEIGGPDAGTGFDQLKVTGDVILESDLGISPNVTVTLINGYNPTAPAAFDVLDFATFTGIVGEATVPTAAWSLADFPTTGEIKLNASGGTGFSAFLTNNGLASATSDEDGDGLNNVLEYALGRLPKSSSTPDGPGALPFPAVTGGSVLEFTLNLPSPAPADVVYTVEAQNGLSGTWTTLATRTGNGSWTGSATVSSLGTAAGRETLRLTDLQAITPSQPRRFLRLRTSIAPAP